MLNQSLFNFVESKANFQALDSIDCLNKNIQSFTFIDLFAGIGGIRIAFESVGGKCVFSSEWDKDARNMYFANFGEYPHGDITQIHSNEIPNFDILLAGFPCQPFSIIGDKEGFKHDTQGTLFFEIQRILKDKKPRAFMLENVRNLVSHDKGNTFKVILSKLKSLGYNVYYQILNALDFGLPQKRERIIICGFLDNVDFNFANIFYPYKQKNLQDILESNVDKKYFVKENIKKSRLKRMKKNIDKPYISHENVGGQVTPHHYSCALRAGASANYLLVNNERRLTEREMLRLQGFNDDFKIVVSYTKLKSQAGNSVAIPVIKEVAKEILKSLSAFDNKVKKGIIC